MVPDGQQPKETLAGQGGEGGDGEQSGQAAAAGAVGSRPCRGAAVELRLYREVTPTPSPAALALTQGAL